MKHRIYGFLLLFLLLCPRAQAQTNFPQRIAFPEPTLYSLQKVQTNFDWIVRWWTNGSAGGGGGATGNYLTTTNAHATNLTALQPLTITGPVYYQITTIDATNLVDPSLPFTCPYLFSNGTNFSQLSNCNGIFSLNANPPSCTNWSAPWSKFMTAQGYNVSNNGCGFMRWTNYGGENPFKAYSPAPIFGAGVMTNSDGFYLSNSIFCPNQNGPYILATNLAPNAFTNACGNILYADFGICTNAVSVPKSLWLTNTLPASFGGSGSYIPFSTSVSIFTNTINAPGSYYLIYYNITNWNLYFYSTLIITNNSIFVTGIGLANFIKDAPFIDMTNGATYPMAFDSNTFTATFYTGLITNYTAGCGWGNNIWSSPPTSSNVDIIVLQPPPPPPFTNGVPPGTVSNAPPVIIAPPPVPPSLPPAVGTNAWQLYYGWAPDQPNAAITKQTPPVVYIWKHYAAYKTYIDLLNSPQGPAANAATLGPWTFHNWIFWSHQTGDITIYVSDVPTYTLSHLDPAEFVINRTSEGFVPLPFGQLFGWNWVPWFQGGDLTLY